jgi:transglutaminase-like putative cysteine protease
MRHGTDERIAVTSALASMLAALTLAPLVSGITWMFVAAITVVTMMVTGIIARQLLRWWPAVAAMQALVLLLTLLVLFARSRIVEGPGAVELLLQLVDAGFQVTREQAPPVEATQGIVLLVAGSTGLIALLVDLLAATLRQPALAGLPLLAVYCVPAALLDGGLPWYYFLLAASGFLLLLTADSGDRVRGWGRVLASSGNVGRRPADGGMAAGGRRVGAAAVLMAVAIPAVVPGLSNQIIGGNGEGDGNGRGGRTITRINPILDLRRDLTSPRNTELLSYTTTVRNPAPLRIVTSDVFDGRLWEPSTGSIPPSQKTENPLPPPPGLGNAVQTIDADTEISIGPLNETYLPLPYPTQSVAVAGDWLYDATTLNVIGDGITTRNLKYKVRHLDVQPTARQLDESGVAPPSITGKYLNLPPNMPVAIADTARRIAKEGSDYRKAIRLQRWFRSGAFEYSLDAPEATSSDAIRDFLEQRKGYCVHFASAMAVMARALNIPARIAVGFLPGDRQPNETWIISANDAHAWPELYFEGVGWTRFEPTPRSEAAAPDWSNPPDGLLGEEPGAEEEPEASSTAAPRESAAPRAPNREGETAPAADTASDGLNVPWRTMLVVLVVLIGLSLPKVLVSLTSRRRWNRATSVPALAEAAWDDLRLGLSDHGVRWAAAWTPRAVEQRLLDDYKLEPEAKAALDRLTDEIENARYAPPSEELGRTAEERIADVSTVVSAVSVLLSSKTRWRARLWPPSGVTTLAALGPWVNTATERASRQAVSLGTQVRSKATKGESRPGDGPEDGRGWERGGPGGRGPGGGPGGPGGGGPGGGPGGGGPGGGPGGGGPDRSGSGGRSKEKVGQV